MSTRASKSRNSGGKQKQATESIPSYNAANLLAKLPLKSVVQGKVVIDSPNTSPKTPVNSRSGTPTGQPHTPLSSRGQSCLIRNNIMSMSPSTILSPLTQITNGLEVNDTAIQQMFNNGRETAISGITPLPNQNSTLPQTISSANQNAIQTDESMTQTVVDSDGNSMTIIQQSDGVSFVLLCLVFTFISFILS